jgi:putative restriction endonuclease
VLNENPSKNWSRDELIAAFNLYCKTPFTKINTSNKGINELASIIQRSPSSVALKLANFARLDPALQQQHISGMRHGSKAEEDIWNEFSNNWEELAYQSEVILAGFKNHPVENSAEIDTKDLPKEGKEREATVKTRVNQYFFRRTVLASYDNKCCITGISIPGLLIASHIIPWAVDKKNRMNPCNGLCLSPLYDAAFDKGLITINPDYKIELSAELKNGLSPDDAFFLQFEGKEITLPQRFIPSKEFLEYHSHNIFKKL